MVVQLTYENVDCVIFAHDHGVGERCPAILVTFLNLRMSRIKHSYKTHFLVQLQQIFPKYKLQQILRVIFLLHEFLTEIENILTRCSAAQVSSIYEKPVNRKSLGTVPFQFLKNYLNMLVGEEALESRHVAIFDIIQQSPQ